MDELVDASLLTGTPFCHLIVEPVMICCECGKEFGNNVKSFHIQCGSCGNCHECWVHRMCKECGDLGKEISMPRHECETLWDYIQKNAQNQEAIKGASGSNNQNFCKKLFF